MRPKPMGPTGRPLMVVMVVLVCCRSCLVFVEGVLVHVCPSMETMGPDGVYIH